MKSLHWGLDEILDRIPALLDVSGGATLLDLCCGHGRNTEEPAARGLWVVGVDRSSGFLRRARSEHTTRARFLLSDVTALPVAEAAVDGTYCWFSSIVYGEAESDRRLLREAWRALRPGARLVVESRNAFVGRRPGEEP
ncbi:MAG TPA: class I SAM-dependent methyltransferase [Gemmatimonadota bacterium]|nr:class I SAM-dependent methyltransferase [Gemmatimonadota bacterium]